MEAHNINMGVNRSEFVEIYTISSFSRVIVPFVVVIAPFLVLLCLADFVFGGSEPG